MNEPEATGQRATADQILQEYDQQRSKFESFCKKVHTYLDERLREKEIPFQTILYRIKDKEKVRTKYDRPSKSGKYSTLQDITDIAGLRVITYYEDDVDAVKEVIESAFEIDLENFEDKREPEDPENFSYHALHLVISLKPSTLGDHSFEQLRGMRGEVQITSVLRHAWAEISHKWYDLDERFPRNVKRRFARLSALIDLADEQFVKLRDEWEQVNSSIDRSVEGGFVDIPIDAQSLRAFIEHEPLVEEIDQSIALADKLILGGSLAERELSTFAKLLQEVGVGTASELRQTLQSSRNAILKFVHETRPHARSIMSPRIPVGFCVFQLATMKFLAAFSATHADRPNEVNDWELSEQMMALGLVFYPATNAYSKYAILSRKLLSE